jgi:hypothetical protein
MDKEYINLTEDELKKLRGLLNESSEDEWMHPTWFGASPPEDDNDLLKMMRTPEILPLEGPRGWERTMEQWLYRLSFWGKVNLYHMPPKPISIAKLGVMAGRNRVNQEQFIRVANTSNLSTGMWERVKTAFNKMYMEREVLVGGASHIERLYVEIDLKPELRGINY